LKRLKSPIGLAILIVIALSIGTATAATQLITGKEIKDHSISGRDIKRKSIPLSALRTVPVSQGEAGEAGEQGEPGIDGEAGPEGEIAAVRFSPISGPIQATIAPSEDPVFVGDPEEVDFETGSHGSVEVTVTIGTDQQTIDDKDLFAIGICVEEEEEVVPILEDGVGLGGFGVSPVIAKGDRVAVTVSTPFVVEGGEPEEVFAALLGPCVLNETTSPLDDNDRSSGTVATAL
jgi:hypothetical protein